MVLIKVSIIVNKKKKSQKLRKKKLRPVVIASLDLTNSSAFHYG